MTHDELLAYMNKEIDQAAWTKEYYPFKSLQALRAVVELHRPQEITLPDGSWGQNCKECDNNWGLCSTIKTITEQLL